MCSERLPKVLIISAGYGEGHHSAARGLLEAFQGKAQASMVDVVAEAMPKMFHYTRLGYLWIIANMPRVWKLMYDASDRVDLSLKPIRGLGAVEQYLEQLIIREQPDLVISTYMLYPYILDRLSKKRNKPIPYMTVVTDSIVINKSWTCSSSPCWLVSDRYTKQVMMDQGIDAHRIHITGFPVKAAFGRIRDEYPLSWKYDEKFHILYFAQRSASLAKEELKALLESHPNVVVTCILGRQFRNIYPSVVAMKSRYRGRLVLRGWTQQVEKYMAQAHLVVGKAGGATTHEVLAAARPILVNYLLPGQEEGNMQLLDYLGGGKLATSPKLLGETVWSLLQHNGRGWFDMYQSMLDANMTGGAAHIVDLALNR